MVLVYEKFQLGATILMYLNFFRKPRSRGRTGHLKKTWLVTVRDNMLPIAKSGISMTVDKTMETSNAQYFVYEHSLSYRQVQQKFINAVESLNPENIIVRFINLL